MNIEKIEIKCPFCDKGDIVCLYFPSILSEKRTVTATFGVKSKVTKTKEKYEVQSDCSNCGKSQKEIQRAFQEGKKDLEKEKKKLKELEKLGLSNIIETKF